MELWEAWSPPRPIVEETKAWEIVIATPTAEPCSLGDMIGIPTMQSYRVAIECSSLIEGTKCPKICASALGQDMDITED